MGQAFGLGVTAGGPLGGLAELGRVPPRHRVTLDRASVRVFDEIGPHDRVVDLRFLDGRPMMSVDRFGGGYRVRAPRHGSHLVSTDGERIRTTPGGRGWRWQRLFYAQVLPLASALQGLDVLHASAVVVNGKALACIAASGSGKTSIATHLVDLGAAPLTDDVLALEQTDRGLVAHPGASFANVDRRELDWMSPSGRTRLGEAIGASEKLHLALRVHREAVPLAAVCFLRRGEQLAVRRHSVPPTQLILGAGFLTHLRTPERLTSHLELSAVLAATVSTYDVELPPAGRAADAATAITRTVSELW